MRYNRYRKYSLADADALRDLYWSGTASLVELAILTDQRMVVNSRRRVICRQTGAIYQLLTRRREEDDSYRDSELDRAEREIAT
jgi:hypothetical protein